MKDFRNALIVSLELEYGEEQSQEVRCAYAEARLRTVTESIVPVVCLWQYLSRCEYP
jgi:hypothetical protein